MLLDRFTALLQALRVWKRVHQFGTTIFFLEPLNPRRRTEKLSETSRF